VFAKTFYFLLNRFGEMTIPPRGSDFALLDRRAVLALLKSVGAHPSLGGEIAKLGFSQSEIPYAKEARKFGHSKWDLTRKLKAFTDAFVSFSYAPLRAMSYLGLMCSLAGFLYAVFVGVTRLATNRPVQGYASLMVAVLLIGGVQMIMLGVLGEYLWRTLDESRRRPLYFVEDSSEAPSPNHALDFTAVGELKR
jgi:dolichol-phosphate mannosyltransferase